MAHANQLTRLETQDLEGLRGLMTACLDHDGGLPIAGDVSLVNRTFLSGPGVRASDPSGRLIAAVALGEATEGVVPVSGAVHPSHRGRGIGASLLGWSIREAKGLRVQLRSESVTAQLEGLALQFGFTKTFGELVMRRPVRPQEPNPIIGFASRSWSTDTARAFFDAYCASFAERPGFPGWTREQWVEHVTGDRGFQPEASMVIFDAGDQPIGFVLVAGSWIDQIGVVPDRRREGIARGLIAHAIGHIAAGGSEVAWLNVNEDNAPAILLYEGLGFTQFGRRAQFEQEAST